MGALGVSLQGIARRRIDEGLGDGLLIDERNARRRHAAVCGVRTGRRADRDGIWHAPQGRRVVDAGGSNRLRGIPVRRRKN